MYLGIDIGSSTSKAVLLDESGQIAARSVANAGTGSAGPRNVIEGVLGAAGIGMEHVKCSVATGYGRMLLKEADKQITEISCHAKGVTSLYKDISTIIDIGGQDAKVIKIGENGAVENFAMNEKCAAGTGRFLEVMARVLECGLDELSDLAAKGTKDIAISSICTVFAESEVISRLAEGQSRENVALGALRSIAKRTVGLGNRIGMTPKIVMTGGVAQNWTLVSLLEEEVGYKILRPKEPQIMGALGAARYALEMGDRR